MAKKILFVSGKGGVGKSTLALCLSRALAQQGRKVLLVELGTRSAAQYLAPMGFSPHFKPQSSPYGFDIALINGSTCLQDYINHYVRMDSLSKLFLNNSFMKLALPVAPGLDDLAILGKITSGVRKHGPPWVYDHIVVDAYSSGSFLSMLQSPKHLSEMVRRGPLNSQSLNIYETLKDSALCDYYFVTLFEDFPVDELVQSTEDFQKTFSSSFHVVANRKLPQVRESEVGSSRFLEQLYKANQNQQKYYEILQGHFANLKTMDLITESLDHYLMDEKGDESRRALLSS